MNVTKNIYIVQCNNKSSIMNKAGKIFYIDEFNRKRGC